MMRTMVTLILAITMIGGSAALADSIASSSGSVTPGFTRYAGTVLDDATGQPLADVCVYAGETGCPNPAVLSDVTGYWAIDFPAGLAWNFHFQKIGYATATKHAPAFGATACPVTSDAPGCGIAIGSDFRIMVVGTTTRLIAK